MKKSLIAFLLSFVVSIPAFADDVILTFSPEYFDKTVSADPPTTPSASENIHPTINGIQWHLSKFWFSSSEMTSVQCGVKSSSPLNAAITLEDPLPISVSEIILTIDNERIPSHINWIKVESSYYYSNSPTEESILIEYDDLKTGDLTFKFQNPKPEMYYTITINSSTLNNTVTNYLQISKIVYKELVEQQTPVLSWSSEKVTATLGADDFEAPTLACDPDNEVLKTLINYSSSDNKVATIDADGKLTILSPGTTTITASIEESDSFAAASASYELTVEADPNTILLSFAAANMSPADGFDQTIKAMTSDGLSWTIKNFNNDANTAAHIVCGGNPNDNTASITTDFPLADHLKEIIVTIDDFKEGKIENITLYSYAEANLNHPVESISLAPIKGDLVFEVTAQPGLKYSIVVNSIETDPDGTLQISKISYHKAADITPAETAKLYISEAGLDIAEFSECTDNTYKSNGNWIILKFDIPENHRTWHRFVNGSEIITPVASAQSFVSRAGSETDVRHGFQQFNGNPFKHIDNGVLEFYTENSSGTRSNVRSVNFTGVTAINEPETISDEATEYYNLQGTRVEHPVDGNIYIMCRGGKATKILKK